MAEGVVTSLIGLSLIVGQINRRFSKAVSPALPVICRMRIRLPVATGPSANSVSPILPSRTRIWAIWLSVP